jgi:hypothetical protein
MAKNVYGIHIVFLISCLKYYSIKMGIHIACGNHACATVNALSLLKPLEIKVAIIGLGFGAEFIPTYQKNRNIGILSTDNNANKFSLFNSVLFSTIFFSGYYC